MKHLIAKCVIASLAVVLGQALAAEALAGPIADKNLEAAVRAVLQEPKADLTDDKLNNVFILDAGGKDIKSLAGLEKCKNLEEFKAAKNCIADLAPLKDLTNLQSLTLSDNKITDLAPLAGLTKLQYLELSNNQVTKVEPL